MAGRVARPNTLVIQCPDQIASMSEHDFMVELFKSIPKSVIRACQFLPKNYVRVTFKDEASRDLALIKGVSVRGFQLNVFEADPKASLVYCYWVPVEVSTDSIRHALSAYGQVMECQRQVHSAFQDIESGVRIVRVKLTSQIPEVIRVLNFPCKIYYRGQPKSCRSRRKTGHQAKDCPFKDKCFRCGSADHQARKCTNAWNVPPASAASGPDAPAAPGPQPSAAPDPHPPAAPGQHPPTPSSGSGLHSGASQEAAPSVPAHVPSVPSEVPSPSQQPPPAPSQNPLVAGLALVPDSPLPCSGMPPLEDLPPGVKAPSPAGALDSQGFLVHRPLQPDTFIPNPCFLSPDASSHASGPSLANNTVGNQECSTKPNVGNQKCSTKPNVGSQKSSTNNTVVGQSSPPLTYSGGQIPNSNPPNSNLPNSNSPNSAQSSIPDVQITGSNSVAPVDSEMASAEDSLGESAELSPEEFKTLRKLLSPANVKRIGLGRLPGDKGLKSKGRKQK